MSTNELAGESRGERNASAGESLLPPTSDAIARQVLSALLSGKIQKSSQGLATLKHIASSLVQPVDEQAASLALEQLSDDERELVFLHRQQGCTMDEIAKLQNRSKDEIIKALARVYARIRIKTAP
jgi:DNA-directed RNA polymerase specialized sigma24 family protein